MESLPPAPLQPETAERSGKERWSTPDCASPAVAFRVKEPEPDGRNQSVAVAASKYCAPAPVTASGAATATVASLVSIFAVAEAADGEDAFPTLSEIV